MNRIALLLVCMLTLPAIARDVATAPAPPATQPAEALTQQQAESLIRGARKTYKLALQDAMRRFRSAAAAVRGAPPKEQEAIVALCTQLDEHIAAIGKDQYLPLLAGEDDPFTIESLAAARQTYVDQLTASYDLYNATLRTALSKDHDGHIAAMMMAELDKSTDMDLMWLLMDWYWNHQWLDKPVGSYEGIIRLGNRYLEMEPRTASVYCDNAWLLWSRWVVWKKEPQRMLIGEGGDEAALRVLLQGRAACKEDAGYHFDAAMTMWGLANAHNAKYFDFIKESLQLSEKHASSPQQHVRARLMLGHTCRIMNQFEEARQWYQRVVELDPNHEVASRMLREWNEIAKKPVEMK